MTTDWTPREYKTTTRGQTLQTYQGWVWQCPKCGHRFATNGMPNDDGEHPLYECPVCLLFERLAGVRAALHKL